MIKYKFNKPLLIATFGYPGSGKTYFSERLAKEANFFHLAVDKIRLAMFEKPKYTKEEHKAVFQFMDSLAEELLKKGISVIYDANFNFRKNRIEMQKLARRAKATYRLVWVKTNEKKALKRLGQRAKLKNLKRKKLYRPIDIKIFRKLQNEMEIPVKTEPVIHIDGHTNFLKQLEQFLLGMV